MRSLKTTGIAAISIFLLSGSMSQALSFAQMNAVREAKSYMSFSGFSHQGLIDQLSSPYGADYDVDTATAAVDSMDIDWNEQAVRAAKDYLTVSGFSCRGLVDQLSSPYGAQFTRDQATYGARAVGVC